MHTPPHLFVVPSSDPGQVIEQEPNPELVVPADEVVLFDSRVHGRPELSRLPEFFRKIAQMKLAVDPQAVFVISAKPDRVPPPAHPSLQLVKNGPV